MFQSILTKQCHVLYKAAIFALLTVAPFFSQAFYAAEPIDVTGYAWSSTIGWISFGNGGNEQLTVNTDGTVTGYAWSSNIGWIRFGGLSGFPGGGGTTAQNARFVNVGGGNFELRGWARACGGAANVSACSGGVNANAGGWDGWIALSGSNHAVRFSSAGPASNSYAWGGPVVGWIDMFSDIELDIPPSATLSLGGCTIALGATTCGGSRTFSFTGVSVADNPRINRIVPTPTQTVSSGQLTGTNISTTMSYGTNRYRALTNSASNLITSAVNVFCVANAGPTGPGGACECTSNYYQTGSTCTEIPRVMNITAERSLIRQAESIDLTFEVAGRNPRCTLVGPGVRAADNPVIAAGGPITNPTTFTYTTVPISNQARFTLTCTGIDSGERSETTTVQVVPNFSEQ